MTEEVKIVQLESEPIAVEILAKSILDLDRAAKKITECGLTTRAIALLIWDFLPTNNPTRAEIAQVLEALPKLADRYAPKRKPK